MGRGIPGKLRQGLGRTSPPLRQGRIQRPCHRRRHKNWLTSWLQQYRRARALLQMSTADRLSLHNFAVAETREKDLNMGSYDQRPPCTTLPCIPRPRRHQPKVTCPDGKLHHNSNRCRLNKATASQCNTFIIYLAFVIPIFTFWFTLFPSKVWLLKPPLFSR